ncbi:nucleoside deaminase [Agriterribacter sp.]|uniref:nucleoside deaminase n=1 Tax=Agriterribacter sp. TaxID=2821509 RepID=UPI002BD9CB21|nr:nucleoside deaminase [Agriterribacter sp.]HTN06083.1 nucleoside deaminase [Agriterribacter sp.]
MQEDIHFMRQAINEARKAFEEEEIPVGAVVVMNDTIIGRGYNQVEKLKDPTAHAEMIALTAAFNYLGSKYLPGARIYITVEPCLMCAGALYWSKIGKIIFGATDEKNGSISRPPFSNYPQLSPFHPKAIVVKDVLQEECAQLIKSFFKNRR